MHALMNLATLIVGYMPETECLRCTVSENKAVIVMHNNNENKSHLGDILQMYAGFGYRLEDENGNLKITLAERKDNQ